MGGHSLGLPVLFPASLAPAAVARYSAESLEADLPGRACLLVAPVRGPEAILIGQFERNTRENAGSAGGAAVFRRGSGGGPLLLGEGRVYLSLRLERSSALTDCDEGRLLNRYVRPLLRALTKITLPSHYFGRDWVACGGAPIASISFAHHAGSGRCMIESVIAFSAPFAPPSPTFLGKTPTTVTQVSSKPRDVSEFCVLAAQAYADAYGLGLDTMEVLPAFPDTPPCALQAPWDAEVPEAIGAIGASCAGGRLALGGALMGSEDAVRELEGRVNALPFGASSDDIGADVNAVFTAPGVALFGVRSLESIRDVAFAALSKGR